MTSNSVSELLHSFDKNVSQALDEVCGSHDERDVSPYILRHYVEWQMNEEAGRQGRKNKNAFGHRVYFTFLYPSGDGGFIKYSKNFVI